MLLLARLSLVAFLLAPMLAPQPAHAFLFLLLAGQEDEPKGPPTEVEGLALNPDAVLEPEGLPAPFLMTLSPREVPPITLAQSQTEPELADILKRLEALEEENKALKQELADAKKAPRDGLPSDALPEQVAYGLWVHIHDWSPDGIAVPGKQVKTYVYKPTTFPATIGFDPKKNGNRRSELRTFRFEGWLRVKEAGTYQIGGLLDCKERRHECHFALSIDGKELMRELVKEGNTIRYAERYLEPGDYRLEYVWGLKNQSYLKYNPGLVSFTPQIRTPEDMNFRNFAEDELLVPDRKDVPIGPTLDFSYW